MKKWVAGTVLVGSLGICTYVQAESEVSTYIVNGENTTIDAYTSFASLFYDRIEFDGVYGTRAFCGATVLDSTHVLTAAHCLYDDDGELNYEYMLFAVVGQTDDESDFPSSVTTVRAEQFFIHPNFQDSESSLWPNDIAIIELESSLNSPGTVSLPDSETYRLGSDGIDNDTNDYEFQIVGHGNTITGADGTTQLQYADMNYVSNNTCNNNLSALTNKQICFKGISTTPNASLTSGTCQGDSGGPVYWDDSGNLVQVGITSFGPSTCGNGFTTSDVTSVFTEVYDYSTWIDSVLAGNETANFVGTDTKRRAYLDGTFDPDDTSGITASASSGGGGSLGPWLLALLASLIVWRSRESVSA